MNNEEDEKICQLAPHYFVEGNHIKALEVIEDCISSRGRDKVPEKFHFLHGSLLCGLANRTETSDLMKFVFSLAAVECYSVDPGVPGLAAVSLYDIAKLLGSLWYYKKALKMAKQGLSLYASFDELNGDEQGSKATLEAIIQVGESELRLGLFGKAKLRESKEEILETRTSRSGTAAAAENRLRSYWESMSVESKRDFMKVSVVKLRGYVERCHGDEGLKALEEVLKFAEENRKWKFWMCRTCSQKFVYPKKLKNHLEQEHAAKFFKPSTIKHIPQRVGDVWAGMISVEGWEPVDAVAEGKLS